MRGHKGSDQVVVETKRRKIALRGPVVRFAVLMEEVLEDNDRKGGWSHMTTGELLRRAGQELKELRKALKKKGEDSKHICDEAADVANFCMMIADNSGGLE